MQDLFAHDPHATPQAKADTTHAPLAEKLRPQSLNDVVGQSHLTGVDMPLRIAFESGQPHSMILWGPPGVGKTTIARLMATAFEADFIALSAVLSGVKEIREAIERATQNQRRGRRTILFIDEVHRFNKSQQDAFLPHVESGLVTFIGATTENPSFELNNALLSRASVHVLKALDDEALTALAQAGITKALPDIAIEADVVPFLVGVADGDGRRLLNLVEQLATAVRTQPITPISQIFAAKILSRSGRRFDKGGDDFYDQISALHKSVRGSDPDASLYWFCRMLDGGTDPRYLARRIIRMAVEDIGLADPRALEITRAAADVYERLGSPEGELALAEAVIYLAVAAKSNAVYQAYNQARAFIAEDGSRPVPLHIRNAPTKLMKSLGMGANYRYAHDEADAYAAGETYLPDGMPTPHWYQPTDRGMEARIREKLDGLRARDADARARAAEAADATVPHPRKN
jgi:putative ATPase